MNRKRKRIYIISAIIIGVIAALGLIYHYVFSPYKDFTKELKETPPLETVLSHKEAAEDLDYIMYCLKKYHPAYVDGSEGLTYAVEEQYEQELNSLGDEVTVLEVWQAASRIISKIHTTHCGVYINRDSEYISDFTEYQQYELLSVNGIAKEELYRKFLSYAFYEYGCEEYAEYIFSSNLVSEAYLQLLDIDTSNGVDFTFSTEDGEKSVHYEFVPSDEIKGYEMQEEEASVSYEIDSLNGIGILKLSYCQNDDNYIEQLNQFFKEVQENHIPSVIVDLRDNPGGNSNVGNLFIEHLAIDQYRMFGNREVRFGPVLFRTKGSEIKVKQKTDAFAGEVYVLTSARTCSAAVDFSAAIADNGLGVIIGEIPGNTPTCYTNMKGVYQTKNSKLRFYIPGTISHRPDSTKDKEPLYPDYETEAWDAMDKAYQLIGLE